MKVISVHVDEEPYELLRSLASLRKRSVAELIREAMAEYLERERTSGSSILECTPNDSGALRRSWTREELLGEMTER